MPPLQVKDFPPDVYERLRQCAREENRSISQQTLTIIEDYLCMRDSGVLPSRVNILAMQPSSNMTFEEIDYAEKHRKILDRINSYPPIPVTDSLPSTVELLRQIREEEAR